RSQGKSWQGQLQAEKQAPEQGTGVWSKTGCLSLFLTRFQTSLVGTLEITIWRRHIVVLTPKLTTETLAPVQPTPQGRTVDSEKHRNKVIYHGFPTTRTPLRE